MSTWIVSRHPGAIAWVQRTYVLGDAHIIEHLDPSDIAPGDRVVGTLPVQAIATIYQQGACYYHLQIPMAREHRGHELDADELDSLGATLECFYARRGDGPPMARQT